MRFVFALLFALTACSPWNNGMQYTPSAPSPTPPSGGSGGGWPPYAQRDACGNLTQPYRGNKVNGGVTITMTNTTRLCGIVFFETTNCGPPWPFLPYSRPVGPNASVPSYQVRQDCLSQPQQFVRFLMGAVLFKAQDCSLKVTFDGTQLVPTIDYQGAVTACYFQQNGPTNFTLMYRFSQSAASRLRKAH
jgi:hypothetical protein